MARAPQKRLLEVHESSVRMNAAAADRCRSDTKKWTKWGDVGDPVLNPQPRRKPRRKRRKTQQRTDQISFSNESVQRIQGRNGCTHYVSKFATATVYGSDE